MYYLCLLSSEQGQRGAGIFIVHLLITFIAARIFHSKCLLEDKCHDQNHNQSKYSIFIISLIIDSTRNFE